MGSWPLRAAQVFPKLGTPLAMTPSESPAIGENAPTFLAVEFSQQVATGPRRWLFVLPRDVILLRGSEPRSERMRRHRAERHNRWRRRRYLSSSP